jgi:hypothetical protein
LVTDQRVMKSVYAVLGAGLASLLAGCSSTPVALAPVGPNPVRSERIASQGQLQVFSRLVEQSDDQNQGSDDPLWYQHTDYRIYNLHGKLVKRVDNTSGHYDQAPRRVALPAGQYLVKAQAQDYLQVEVPVTIEAGRTTRVHLDNNWKLPASTSKRELVSTPNGIPVGWRAESTKG